MSSNMHAHKEYRAVFRGVGGGGWRPEEEIFFLH